MYLRHPWGILTCPMIFVLSSVNELNHPDSVPFDLNVVLIRLRGLLAYTVIACSDKTFLINLTGKSIIETMMRKKNRPRIR